MSLFATLPQSIDAVQQWSWEQYAPYFAELEQRSIEALTVSAWLADWTHVQSLIIETRVSLLFASNCHTDDAEMERAYLLFQSTIAPYFDEANQRLKARLLSSHVFPEDFAIPLRNMTIEADLFRSVNIPLWTQEQHLRVAYNKVISDQSVLFDEKEHTLTQIALELQTHDRQHREDVWRQIHERTLADRASLNDIWKQLLTVRTQIAQNVGYTDYRTYKWRELKRVDYTPDDCLRFHEAIEQVVVPAAKRIYERRRQRLGLDTLRPWDLHASPEHEEPLKPFTTTEELVEHIQAIFTQIDPVFGEYFATMRREHVMDLPNRPHKAPGGYCVTLPVRGLPVIFMNTVGRHDDVMTMLHESGHGFHIFESARKPYLEQREGQVCAEMAEVASLSMELLAFPYLEREMGGFYTARDAKRAWSEHIENRLLGWAYIAVVDAFQHAVYTNTEDALDPAWCDHMWGTLWDRFMGGIDYSAYDDVKLTGWQRKLHIFETPFYYIEYGMAQLGAVQIWRNSLTNAPDTLRKYRTALAQGNTVSIPEFYALAGARFALDAATLQESVDLMETMLAKWA